MLTEFSEKWKNASDYTLELARSVPEESYSFKPTEDQMSFSEQLLHISRNMHWLSTSYLGSTAEAPDFKRTDYSKEEVLAILTRCLEQAGAAAADLPLEELDEKVDFFAGPKSKRQILVLMNDHMTHHRGQLIVYLRLKGIQPPKYRGW